MKIVVEYFGPARETAGVVREVVDATPGVTAGHLVEKIARARAGRFASLLLGPDGTLAKSVLLAVENRPDTSGAETVLVEGDEIVVIPPVAGG